MAHEISIAQKQGILDRKIGKLYAENPYKESSLRGAWQSGWRYADGQIKSAEYADKCILNVK